MGVALQAVLADPIAFVEIVRTWEDKRTLYLSDPSSPHANVASEPGYLRKGLLLLDRRPLHQINYFPFPVKSHRETGSDSELEYAGTNALGHGFGPYEASWPSGFLFEPSTIPELSIPFSFQQRSRHDSLSQLLFQQRDFRCLGLASYASR